MPQPLQQPLQQPQQQPKPQAYVPPPRKRRRYSKVNYPMKKFSFPEIPWVVPLNYYPCPHSHLHERQYNRDLLSPQEHQDVLATPRGYRWYGKNSVIIKRATEGKPVKKRLIAPKPPFPGFKQFLAEIWDVLTPEMIICLKEILEEEFEMSAEEAVEFLLKQRAKALRQAKAETLGPAPHVRSADISWARDIALVLADKMTKTSEMMTVCPRSKRTRTLKTYLTKALHELAGLGVEGDHTPTRKLLYRLGEVLAVWLNSLPGEGSIAKICDTFSTAYSTISL